MATKSIKLDIIQNEKKPNQFKLAHIGENVESYAYMVDKTEEGNLVFVLDVQKGLQITEVPDDSDLTSLPTVKKPITDRITTSLEPKPIDAEALPTGLSTYFKLKENTCRCHPNVATEFILKFVVPKENARIETETHTETDTETETYLTGTFLKIGTDLGKRGKESAIKMELRHLEQKDVYSIRNINLQVESFCMPYSDISMADNGKIVIVLDLQAGMELIKPDGEAEFKTPKTDLGSDMCLVYNDNMVRFVPNKEGKAELEFTLKLLIYSTNVLYINNLEKFQQVMGSNNATNVINNSVLNYTALANTAVNNMALNQVAGGKPNYFDLLFSDSPAAWQLYDNASKVPPAPTTGKTLDYFNDAYSDDPVTLGDDNKSKGNPTNGMLISKVS